MSEYHLHLGPSLHPQSHSQSQSLDQLSLPGGSVLSCPLPSTFGQFKVASIIANPFIKRPVIPHSVIAYRSPSISLTQSRSDPNPAHPIRSPPPSAIKSPVGIGVTHEAADMESLVWRSGSRGRLKTPMRALWSKLWPRQSYCNDA